jgi:hypothetical protein
MYSLIWRILPGPVWLKVVWALILAAAVVWALFTWGYPWISDTFVGTDPNLG